MKIENEFPKELPVSSFTGNVRNDGSGGPKPSEDDDNGRWVSRSFLDILREHIYPNLARFYLSQAAVECCADEVIGDNHCASSVETTCSPPCLVWHGSGDLLLEARDVRQAQAAIALVCSDWAVAQRQAEQELVQVRLWDGGQVRSLASYLRCHARVTSVRLQSPPSDVMDAPGMVAAVGDLLYGSADGDGDGTAACAVEGGAVAGGSGGSAACRPGGGGGGGSGGGGGAEGHDHGDPQIVGGGGDDPIRQQHALPSGRVGCALPTSLRSLEADGPTAVPLLLLAAASELPFLECVSLCQLPAVWTYREGALPWPRGAGARLARLLPRVEWERAADPELYTLMYGAAVNRRFNSYWSSYDGALAALLYHRAAQLREVSLEAPTRSVGLRVLERLAAPPGGRSPRLQALRLQRFGLRREPHQPPRVPLERSGLRLELALKGLAAVAATQQAESPPRPQGQQQQCQQQQQEALQALSRQGDGRGGGAANSSSAANAGISGGGGSSSLPLAVSGYCCLTRLELLACGCAPLDACALEGLTGLRFLSLRDSCLTWRDRPPDLRPLRHLASLDLRRSNWLTSAGEPWDEHVLRLPPSLEALDIAGFSSLTAADLSPLERLTALAELADITLLPDPAIRAAAADGSLQLPYSGLAALTCMETVRMYVGRTRSTAGRRADGNAGDGGFGRCRGSEEGEEEEGEGRVAAEELGGGSSSGGSDDSSDQENDGSSSSGESVRCEALGARLRQRGGGRGGRGRRGWQRSGGPTGGSSSSGGGRIGRRAHSSGACGSTGGSSCTSSAVAAVAPRARPSPACIAPPLVSLTLYGVLPQFVSDLFPALPLLTRLMFGGREAEPTEGTDSEGGDSEGDGEDAGGVGRLVVRAGELPRLRELELNVGLLGYGRLALGPLTALTRLILDDVEYVDVRYIELPPSLQHLALTAWFGLPELYHLAEGPLLPPAAALLARAAAGRIMQRAAAAGGGGRGCGHGSGGTGAGGSSSSSGGGAIEEESGDGDWELSAGPYHREGEEEEEEEDAAAAFISCASHSDLTRALESEVERQLAHRLLPPLRQLRSLQLNWDLVTRGPFVTATGAATVGGSGGGCTAARWPFPVLPLLEELNIPWMQELPEGDLRRLLASCPQLRGVSHGNGSRRTVRGPDGRWIRRCVGQVRAEEGEEE